MARNSLYWDDFNRRIDECVSSLKDGITPPVRRVSVFITDKCNFRCEYCNHENKKNILSKERFIEVVEQYGKTAIIHITGGEPSVVPWLYEYIRANGHKYRFHLNTNAYIMPPSKSLKRLKISLDSTDAKEWDCLVKKDGAFNRVVTNIKRSIPETVVTLTYTLTKQNYKNVISFAQFVNKEFDGLYAVFFSVYKGSEKQFVFDEVDGNDFFNNYLPKLKEILPTESRCLIEETIDEKKRLIQGKRFENDLSKPCYISLSERVISSTGLESNCSHLFRDGITDGNGKHDKCLYGCNQRLIMFNNEVEKYL